MTPTRLVLSFLMCFALAPACGDASRENATDESREGLTESASAATAGEPPTPPCADAGPLDNSTADAALETYERLRRACPIQVTRRGEPATIDYNID